MGFHDILYMTYNYEKEKKTIINKSYLQKNKKRLDYWVPLGCLKSHLMFLINSCVFYLFIINT